MGRTMVYIADVNTCFLWYTERWLVTQRDGVDIFQKTDVLIGVCAVHFD